MNAMIVIEAIEQLQEIFQKKYRRIYVRRVICSTALECLRYGNIWSNEPSVALY